MIDMVTVRQKWYLVAKSHENSEIDEKQIRKKRRKVKEFCLISYVSGSHFQYIIWHKPVMQWHGRP